VTWWAPAGVPELPDGAVSEGEAKVAMPGVAERFDKFDGNGDGKLTRDEMHNFRVKQKRGEGGLNLP
jgi:hypothetical protein